MKKLRSDIDQIHKQIFALLIKRVNLTEKIWKIKKENKIKLTDPSRESVLIHMFDDSKEIKNNPELKKMIQQIQKAILTENKKYLKNAKK